MSDQVSDQVRDYPFVLCYTIFILGASSWERQWSSTLLGTISEISRVGVFARYSFRVAPPRELPASYLDSWVVAGAANAEINQATRLNVTPTRSASTGPVFTTLILNDT